MDDERAVLQLLAAGLPGFGIRVRTAPDGPAAVEAFRHDRDEIGLVLLDVRMAPWDGPRTLAELRRIDPDVPAAFMSAEPGRYGADELLGLGAAAVIPKPFVSIADLARELRQLSRTG